MLYIMGTFPDGNPVFYGPHPNPLDVLGSPDEARARAERIRAVLRGLRRTFPTINLFFIDYGDPASPVMAPAEPFGREPFP